MFDVCRDDYAFFDIALWKANNDTLRIKLDNPPIGIKHGLGDVGGNYHRASRFRKFDSDEKLFNELFNKEARDFYKSLEL